MLRNWMRGGSSGLCSLDVIDGDFASAAVFARVEADLLAFDQAAQTGAFKSRGMDKDVLAAVVRLNEAETTLCVVEFNHAGIHRVSLFDRCVDGQEMQIGALAMPGFVEIWWEVSVHLWSCPGCYGQSSGPKSMALI